LPLYVNAHAHRFIGQQLVESAALYLERGADAGAEFVCK